MRTDNEDLTHSLKIRPHMRQTIETPDTLNEAKSDTYIVLRTDCRHARAPPDIQLEAPRAQSALTSLLRCRTSIVHPAKAPTHEGHRM